MRARLKLGDATEEYLTRRRLADNTIANYRSTFSLLFQATGGDIYLDNVTPNHIDKVLRRYENSGSYNVRLTQLHTFFAWCIREEYLRKDPTRNIDTMKVVRQGAITKYRIPIEEWGNILDIAGKRHPLNRIIMACGLYLGQRGNELTAVKLRDLHRDPDGVVVAITITRTKTGEVTQVPVFTELAEEIDQWLAWYGRKHGDDFGNLPPNAYLIPARQRGKQARLPDGTLGMMDSDRGVQMFKPLRRPYRIVQETLKDAGYYQKGEGAHTLRRSLAVSMYQADIDLGYAEALDNVKTMLGHSTVTTTEGYLGTSLGKDRLNKRVQRQRLFVREEAPDNVVDFRRDHG